MNTNNILRRGVALVGALGIGLMALRDTPALAQAAPVPAPSGVYSYIPWALNGGSNSVPGNASISAFTNSAGSTNAVISQAVGDYEWVGVWAGFNFITNGAPPYNISATNLVTLYFVNSGDGAQFETTNTPAYRMTGIGQGTNFVWTHTNFFVPSEGSLQLVNVTCSGTNTGVTLSNLSGAWSFKASRKTTRPN